MNIRLMLKTTAGRLLHLATTVLASDNPMTRTTTIGAVSATLSGIGTYLLGYGWPTIAAMTTVSLGLPFLSGIIAYPLNKPSTNTVIRKIQRAIKSWWRTTMLTLPPVLIPSALLNSIARDNLAISIPALCLVDPALATSYEVTAKLLATIFPGFSYTGRITASSGLTAGALAAFLTDDVETILLSFGSSAAITFLLTILAHCINNEAHGKSFRGVKKNKHTLPTTSTPEAVSYNNITYTLAAASQMAEGASQLASSIATAKLLIHHSNHFKIVVIILAQFWLTNTLIMHKLPSWHRNKTQKNNPETTPLQPESENDKDISTENTPQQNRRKSTIVTSVVSYIPFISSPYTNSKNNASPPPIPQTITIEFIENCQKHVPQTDMENLIPEEQLWKLAENIGKLSRFSLKLTKNTQQIAAMYCHSKPSSALSNTIKVMRVTNIYCEINDKFERTNQLLVEIEIVTINNEPFILVLPLTSYEQMSFAEHPKTPLLTAAQYHQLSKHITNIHTQESLEKNDALSLPEHCVILHQRSHEAWTRANEFGTNKFTHQLYMEIQRQHEFLEKSPILKQYPLGALLKTTRKYDTQIEALESGSACITKIDQLLKQYDPNTQYFSILAELNNAHNTPDQNQGIAYSFSYDPKSNTTMKNTTFEDSDSDSEEYMYEQSLSI